MGNKKINWFDIFKWVLSFFITVGLAVLGAFCHKNEGYSKVACIVAVIVLPIALICWIIANFVLKKRFENSIDRKNLQNELVAQRDRAEEIAKEKISTLKRLIKAIDICSVAVLLGSCLFGFCLFCLLGAEGGGVAVLIMVAVYTGLYFVRPRGIKINEKKSEDYLAEKDYPLIYETAYKAAGVIGCEGKIRVFISHDSNVGILMTSDGYSISLGSYLISILTRDELYNVLLHEFAHVEKKNDEINSIVSYVNVYEDNENSGLALPYVYFIVKFAFEFFTYKYVCNLMHEDEADAAMLKYGNPEIAASSLIKTKFSQLYEWEMGTYDSENIFESETLIDDFVRRPIRWFKERIELRKAAWIGMIENEIISRNATHATTKMRIRSLGITQAKLVESVDSEEYLAEVDKAILYLEDMIKKAIAPNYSIIREQSYCSSKKIIDDWESNGKKITKENYQSIIASLFELNKISEFVNLCCQVIEEIPEPSNYVAHRFYGMYLLHSYDERGVEHLYRSVEMNHGNWEEALSTIGEYACIVGKQDQLDKYRERAERMMDSHIDVYEKMESLVARDVIVEEHLPEEMLTDMLRYFESIDTGIISKIHMVRKVIDDKHFVTCIIVSPNRKAKPQEFGEVMEKIFQYLDKSSDWEFSLFDMRFMPKSKITRVKNSCIYSGKKKQAAS